MKAPSPLYRPPDWRCSRCHADRRPENDAELPPSCRRGLSWVIEQQPAGVARCQGNPLSGRTTMSPLASAVLLDRRGPPKLERSSQRRGYTPDATQGADFSAHREVQALPARAADVVKVAGIGRGAMNWRSSRLRVRKTSALQCKPDPQDIPRRPIRCSAQPPVSDPGRRKSFGSPHGRSGFEHPSSTDARCATRLVVVGVVTSQFSRRDGQPIAGLIH